MKHRLRILSLTICVAVSLMIAPPALQAAATAAEKLYADLAKLNPAERSKRLEEGALKEGKLTFIHTFRGKLARDQVRLFEKRYPFVKVELTDMGSQDAAERLIAEETAKRHLTDAISLDRKSTRLN